MRNRRLPRSPQLETRIKEIEELLLEKFRLRDQHAQVVDKLSVKLDQARTAVKENEEHLRKLREDQDSGLEGERKLEFEYAKLQGELSALITNTRNQFNLDLTSESFVAGAPLCNGRGVQPGVGSGSETKAGTAWAGESFSCGGI